MVTSWAYPTSTLPDEVLQDPVWERSGRTERGRDACRVPLPWSGTDGSYGFSSRPDTWLPMPAGWSALTAEAQSADPASMRSLYRLALALRATSPAFSGNGLEWLPAPAGCPVFRRPRGGVCLPHLSRAPAPPPGGRG